jgi:hypothetical protein
VLTKKKVRKTKNNMKNMRSEAISLMCFPRFMRLPRCTRNTGYMMFSYKSSHDLCSFSINAIFWVLLLAFNCFSLAMVQKTVKVNH